MIVATPLYLPSNSVGGFPFFSTPSPAFIICRRFDDGHSDWCEVIPHCSLKCISLIISDKLSGSNPLYLCVCLQCRTLVRYLGQEGPLEKGMATHCSILAWRTPWTEEPGGPQSTGSQRVGHNSVTITFFLLIISDVQHLCSSWF